MKTVFLIPTILAAALLDISAAAQMSSSNELPKPSADIWEFTRRGEISPSLYTGTLHLSSGFDPVLWPSAVRDTSCGKHFFRLNSLNYGYLHINDGSDFPTLVRRDVVDIFSHGRFSGWDASPAQVLFSDGFLSRDYFELHVSGHCPIDPLISVPVPVVWVNPRRKNRSTGFKGFPLDTGSWDGSDIFRAGDSDHVFISRSLRDALFAPFRDYHIKNAADCLITDILPYSDMLPLLAEAHKKAGTL